MQLKYEQMKQRSINTIAITLVSTSRAADLMPLMPATHLPEIGAKKIYTENRYRFLTHLTFNLQ